MERKKRNDLNDQWLASGHDTRARLWLRLRRLRLSCSMTADVVFFLCSRLATRISDSKIIFCSSFKHELVT